MSPSNLILLGTITKVHGFEGAVTVKTEINLSENIPRGEPVFLQIEGRPVPFFIEYTDTVRPGQLILKFEDYNSDEKVREFVGCDVLISHEAASEENREDLSNLLGFTIISDIGDLVGVISEIIPNPGQVLLEVTSPEGRKLLIPLHEDLIRLINNDVKTLTMIIPEGLTGIN
jgi:16S rRNA processing protein RimM